MNVVLFCGRFLILALLFNNHIFTHGGEDEDKEGEEGEDKEGEEEDKDGSGSGSGSGDGGDAWDSYNGDDNFFSFNEYGDNIMHWSDFSIYPEACVNREGSDVIVFSVYSSGNNGCKRRSLGKFHVTVGQYLKSLSKTYEKDAEFRDDDFEEFGASAYLDCAISDSDDDVEEEEIYLKLGCRKNSYKAFAVNSYSDNYCSQQLDMYNFNIDLSDIQVNFESCQSCTGWNFPDDDGFDDEIMYAGEYFSPLCSATWNYKQECDGKCLKALKLAKGNFKKGFSIGQHFLIFLLSLAGFVSLLGIIRGRRKMSTEDSFLEESQMEYLGLKREDLPRIFLGTVIFVFLLMVLKFKALTFFFLITIDVFLLGYWARLEYREKGKIELGGFQLYGDDEDRYDDR